MILFVGICFGQISFAASTKPLKVGATADCAASGLDVDMELLGSVRPKSTAETKNMYWTIGCETVDRDFTIYDEYKDYLAPLGIRKARFQCGWAKTEKVKGQYDFAWIDEVVNDLTSKNIQMWAQLSYGNPIYEGAGGFDLGAGLPSSEEGLAAWDRWVKAMVERYKDRVHEWEIWNEADGNRTHTPAALIAFTIRTAKIIKSVDPKARIAGLTLCRLNPKWVKPFVDELKRLNAVSLFDWISYHAYEENPDLCYNAEYMDAASYIRQGAPTIRIRQGESGCPSEYQIKRHALKNYHWSELTQAKWFLRRMMGDMGHDVDDAAVFCMMDMIYLYNSADATTTISGLQQNLGYEDMKNVKAEKFKFFNRFGLIMCDSNYHAQKIKQSYYAVRNTVSVFDQPLKRVKDSPAQTGKLTIYEYLNTENKSRLFVVWNGTNIPADTYRTETATVCVENASFKKPVWVDLLSGRIYLIPANCITRKGNYDLLRIPVFDSPVVLADLSSIPH